MSYRNISSNFWTDGKVDEDFTPEDKYFYLYLLTNPHTNICGCYEISLKQMSQETGYNTDTVIRLIKRMEEVHKVVKHSASNKEMLIVNWSKYNWAVSDKLIKAVESTAAHIKTSSFKNFVYEQIELKRNEKKERTKERITETVTVSETVSETVSDTDTVSDVSIGYTYPIDTVSEKSKPMKPSPNQIISLYNEVCADLPKARNQISANRRKAIIARLSTYSLEEFHSLFTKAQASDFLKGKNDRNWRADFDWLMKDANFCKVLEGKYDNKDNSKPVFDPWAKAREEGF